MAYTTINKGSLYMNTVLYTGNGGTQSITGVNFQPDWVWVKERSGANSHMLADSVRGATKIIFSNLTNAEDTDANSITAFNSDGFSVGSSGNVNANSDTYVGWNWLSGGTAPAQTYSVKVVSDGGNKYRFDDFGTSAVTLDLQEGGTYTFDQSDSSNSGHPLRFSTTSNGTHGGGSEYTTGVTTNGTPGQAGAYTRITVAASAPTLYYYCTVHSGMGGQANTNTTFGSSNFSGSIQSKVSANTTSGFSIVKYTGTGSVATVGHGLSTVPKMIIYKPLIVEDWTVYHASLGATNKLDLNNNSASSSNSSVFNNTAPTSSVFTVGTNGRTNSNGNGIIAYCFAEKKGFSKFGSYTGNGNADGTFVYTGFKPAFVLKKNTTNAREWNMEDNKRIGYNPNNYGLFPHNADAEQTGYERVDFLSNGFKLRTNSEHWNESGNNFVYMAFAENPFVGSDGTPVTAR